MNILQHQILDEIAQLDIKSLMVLQNLLPSLKRVTTKQQNNIGTGAKLTTKALSNISNDLSKAIIEEREDRQ